MRVSVSFIAIFVLFLSPLSVTYGATPIAAAAEVETENNKQFMFLDELDQILKVRKRVKGYFETVVQGRKIERFKFEIKGIVEDLFFGKIIVIIARRPIAAGMSGSPAYVDNKLIGAIALSFNALSREYWGGIQPIESMLNEEKEGQTASYASGYSELSSLIYKEMTFKPIPLGSNILANYFPLSNTENVKINSGLSRFLRQEQLVISSGYKSNEYIPSSSLPSLKPGMPILVDLIELKDESGETITASALGTITYIDPQGKIYAFGHPFLGAKHIYYSFRTCEIIGTVPSALDAYKMAGKQSGILGVIHFDGLHGVYGKIQKNLTKFSYLKHFTLELQKNGEKINRFEISVANSRAFTPLLTSFALGIIGSKEGAPLSTEPSTTELKADIDIQGHKPIKIQRVYTNQEMLFGFSILRLSSYEVAVRSFISGMYTPIFTSNFQFDIVDTHITANFILGQPKTLKLASYQFPKKVIFGQNPLLKIILVSQNNTIAFSKTLSVPMDWSKIESPVYSAEVKETEKESEKKIWGHLNLYSKDAYNKQLSEDEKQLLKPAYFLSPGDFLSTFNQQLQVTNQRLYGKIQARAKSETFELNSPEEDEFLNFFDEEGFDWHVIQGGLKKRSIVHKDRSVILPIEFPRLPSGYILSGIDKYFSFEIVAPE